MTRGADPHILTAGRTPGHTNPRTRCACHRRDTRRGPCRKEGLTYKTGPGQRNGGGTAMRTGLPEWGGQPRPGVCARQVHGATVHPAPPTKYVAASSYSQAEHGRYNPCMATCDRHAIQLGGLHASTEHAQPQPYTTTCRSALLQPRQGLARRCPQRRVELAYKCLALRLCEYLGPIGAHLVQHAHLEVVDIVLNVPARARVEVVNVELAWRVGEADLA